MSRWMPFVAAALVSACGFTSEPAGPLQREHAAFDLDGGQLAHVRLSVSAGTLDVKGGSSRLAEANFAFNVPAWKPNVVYRPRGDERDLEMTQPGSGASFSNTENTWDVALNDAIAMDLSAELGAGEAKLQLGNLNLRRVSVRVGAGRVEMDLRGTPKASYTAEVRGGVGEAVIYVPATVAISATASGGLGSINVSGLEQRGERWVNPKVPTSPVSITLDITGGVGEIRIEAR